MKMLMCLILMTLSLEVLAARQPWRNLRANQVVKLSQELAWPAKSSGIVLPLGSVLTITEAAVIPEMEVFTVVGQLQSCRWNGRDADLSIFSVPQVGREDLEVSAEIEPNCVVSFYLRTQENTLLSVFE